VAEGALKRLLGHREHLKQQLKKEPKTAYLKSLSISLRSRTAKRDRTASSRCMHWQTCFSLLKTAKRNHRRSFSLVEDKGAEAVRN